MTNPSIGIGLAALGRPSYITSGRIEALGAVGDRTVEALRARVWRVLDSAWELGIRFIDVARSYGYAEEFLGDWLASHPDRRDHLRISSKWGYEYVAGWDPAATVHERKEHSTSMLRAQWPLTLRALGTKPDFYLIHSATPDSGALENRDLLRRLRRLADDGTRIGLSTSGTSQARTIESALDLHSSPFSAVQATWNLLERSAEAQLAAAAAAGWTVVIKETLANGRLAPGQLPAADRLAMAGETTTDVLAIAAAVAQPWADIVLLGPISPSQLASNVRASVQHVDVDALDALAMSPMTYWNKRSALPWT